MKKALLVSIDGMRTDGALLCAPTITKIMGTQADREWEGKSLV